METKEITPNSRPLPTPQSIGREFIRQYYKMLVEGPQYVHMFYSDASILVYGIDGKEIVGRSAIQTKIRDLGFETYRTHIRAWEKSKNDGENVFVEVNGEIGSNGGPMRGFSQTFVLVPLSKKKFYIETSTFWYNDELFGESAQQNEAPAGLDAEKTDFNQLPQSAIGSNINVSNEIQTVACNSPQNQAQQQEDNKILTDETGDGAMHSEQELAAQMAENVCRYYLRGACQYGEQCRFHHTPPLSGKEFLCPRDLQGQCQEGDACMFTHGIECNICKRPALHPQDPVFNAKHRRDCVIAGGKEKKCGICKEVVMQHDNAALGRFGILPRCKHCFCLHCIREWRSTNRSTQNVDVQNNEIQHDVEDGDVNNNGLDNDEVQNGGVQNDGVQNGGVQNDINQALLDEDDLMYEDEGVFFDDDPVVQENPRACPECRIVSDFVIPSLVWIDRDDQKDELIKAYYEDMQKKNCRNYLKYLECPFGKFCFYRHLNPHEGTVVKTGFRTTVLYSE